MAADRVLCSKPCALQNADKTFTDGMMYVYQRLARFVPKGGAAQQRLELAVGDIKGQKRSKNNPLLMLEMPQAKPVFKFASAEERDEVTAAITQAQQLQQAAAEPAAAAAAAAGGPAGAPAAPARAAGPAVLGANQSAAQLAMKIPPQRRLELLRDNPELAARFKALVTDTKALSEDEFWSSTAVQKSAGIAGEPSTTERASRRGLTNRLVDLFKKKEGDALMTKVNFTAEDEQQLLAEKPALRQIYDAQVGTVMTAAEFWQRYFRYYMNKRHKRQTKLQRFKQLQQNIMADSAAAVADMTGVDTEETDYELSALFSALEANSSLDEGARKSLRRRFNPAVDLAAAAEDRLTADGYGLAHNAARSEAEQVQGYSALSQQLAQEYNVHAAAVIGQTPSAPAGSNRPSSSAAAAAAADRPGAVVLSELSEEERQRFTREAGSGLDDLAAPLHQQFEELHVTNPRLYFSHIQQQQQPSQPTIKQEQGLQQQQQQQQQQPATQLRGVVQAIRDLDPDRLEEQPLQRELAHKVLVDLCGGEVGDATRRGGPTSLPQQLLDTMQQQTMLVDELLRHFWAQIPVNNPEKKAKLERIQASLQQRSAELQQLEDQCALPDKATLRRLTKPLWLQLETATNAYKAVQQALAKKPR